MLTLDTLDVTTFDVENPTLTWTFEATTEALSGYSIDVYRSEAPDNADALDSYDLVEAGISPSTYSYTDISVSGLYHHNRTWYYKLLISGIGTSSYDIVPTIPAYVSDDSTNRPWIEILRRKQLVMNRTDNRYSGIDLYLLKRRTWGTRCTDCWDEITQRITEANCSVCLGTGWVDGYFDPISVRGMLNPAPKFNEINMFGEWMPSDTLLTMLNFPPLKSKDMVVDSTNGERWIVVGQPRQTKKKNVVIEQRAQLALLQADDPLYDITITL